MRPGHGTKVKGVEFKQSKLEDVCGVITMDSKNNEMLIENLVSCKGKEMSCAAMKVMKCSVLC